MSTSTRIPTLIMVLSLAACGDKFGQSEGVNISHSNKPASPFVMPDRQLKKIFTAPDVSFYLDEQGKPTAWGRQTCMPEDLDEVVSIANGASGPYAAVKSDGSVVTWDCYERSLPIPDDLRNVKALAVGQSHTLVLKENGTVEAWGSGPGMTEMPADMKDVVAVSAGEDHGLALHRNGRVTAWDGNIGCCIQREAFPRVDLSGVVAIASGENHNLALRDDGTVVAWGSEAFFPSIPPGLTDEFGAIAIAVGDRKNYALLANGTLWSWGWQSTSLRNVKTFPEAVDISAEDNHGLAQKRDGSLMSWGYGISSLLPSELAAGVASVASNLSLLLKADGEVIPLDGRQVVLGSDAPVLRVDADVGLAAAIHGDNTLSLWGSFILGGRPGVWWSHLRT